MNHKQMLTIVACLCSTYLLVGQSQYPISEIPSSLLDKAKSVVRVKDYTYKIIEDDEIELTKIYAVTILNNAADRLGKYMVGESSFEKTKYLEGRIFDADGKLQRESKKSDIKEYGGSGDVEFSDGKVKVLDLRYNQYPYTVEFKVKQQIKGFFMIPPFDVAELGQSVQHAAFRLNAPNEYAFQWKGIHTEETPLKITVEGRTEWLWAFDSLGANPDEVYPPFFRGDYVQLVIAPKKIKIDDYTGLFDNWNHIGQFFYDLNKGRDQLSPEMQAKVAELTNGMTNDRDKIKVLYRYLQTNHRYISIQIGIGGWQTFDAKFVEQKRYGDCKALSNYMKALLLAAGIPSYLTLVYAGDDGAPTLYEEAPAPFFNHVILYIPNEALWLECTSNENPMGYLGDFTADRQVLLLTPDGGKLVRTPISKSHENIENNHCSILLNTEGQAEIKNKLYTTGERHDRYRHWAAQMKQPELEKEFTHHLGFNIQKINVLQINADENRPETTVQYEVSSPNYASKSGKRIFVPLLKIHPFQRVLPANATRKFDVHIRTVYTFSDTITIQFPAGFTIENVALNKKISSDFGSYEYSIDQMADHITVIRRLEILPVSVPASRYQEVRQFYLDISRMDNAQAVLVGNQ